MALIIGVDKDHYDARPVTGGDITRHMLKDAKARADIATLMSAVQFEANGEAALTLTDYSATTSAINENKVIKRSSTRYVSRQIPYDSTWAYLSVTANASQAADVSFLTILLPTTPTPDTQLQNEDFATGETGPHFIPAGTTAILTIPSDTAYIVIATKYSNEDCTPASVKIQTKVYAAIGGKQDALTFDNAPTSGSANPVTSGGIFTTLDAMPQLRGTLYETNDLDSLGSKPGYYTWTSSNVPAHAPVASASGRLIHVYYTGVSQEQIAFIAGSDVYIRRKTSSGWDDWIKVITEADFDAAPRDGSTNPVTSGGVAEAIQYIADHVTYPFEDYIQKNISASSGYLSNTNADKTITSNDLIRTDYIFKITSGQNNIRFYKYGADRAYLGNATLNKKTIMSTDMQAFIAANPDVKYLRVKWGTDDYPVSIDPESQYYWADNDVSMILFTHEDEPEEDQSVVTFSRIAPYGEDGVFTSQDGVNPLTFTIKIPYNGDPRNQIFTCIAKYTQDEGISAVPTVEFYTAGSTSNLNRTTAYTLGGKESYETKQWRVIRYPGQTAYAAAVFTIPAGVTVTIKDFYNEYSDRIERHPYGIRINGHRRFPTTPQDTMPGVEMAIKSGACAMIEIPKRLSDGVWIFYHDDSLVYNDTYIRQADGTELPSTYNGTLWSAIDSATAFSWDWGVSTGALFADLKPMRMEEFFLACGKAGIMPMLSMHPWPSSSELQEIKAIARKCGVLPLLGIKCSAAHIAEAYAAFGNEIESYTVDVSSGSQAKSVVEAAIAAMAGLSGCTVRKAIELFASTAYYAYCNTTEANRYDAFKLISDAGFVCAIAQQTGSYHPTAPNGGSILMKPTDVDYWTGKGVTEYTYEYNWSTGLNW